MQEPFVSHFIPFVALLTILLIFVESFFSDDIFSFKGFLISFPILNFTPFTFSFFNGSFLLCFKISSNNSLTSGIFSVIFLSSSVAIPKIFLIIILIFEKSFFNLSDQLFPVLQYSANSSANLSSAASMVLKLYLFLTKFKIFSFSFFVKKLSK